jgi:hypothetical protein
MVQPGASAGHVETRQRPAHHMKEKKMEANLAEQTDRLLSAVMFWAVTSSRF